MRGFFVFLGVVLTTIGSALSAQEVDSTAPLQKSSWGDAKTDIANNIPEISLGTRLGFTGAAGQNNDSFYGDGIYVDINGTINPYLSYSSNSLYNDYGLGINWLTLTYENENYSLTAGKDALLVGSFEYIAYDIDSYYDMNSYFYNSIDCWQWGVSGSWYPTEEHSITLQIAASPFSYGKAGLFAYNLGWMGTMGEFESNWTVNLWETTGSSVKAINLGNRFTHGLFRCDLDLMTRATNISKLFLTDFTLILAPSFDLDDWGRAFAKVGWDCSSRNLTYDLAFGGDYVFYGIGFEYFPLHKNKNVRLHTVWTANNIGMNIVNLGITWKMDLTGALKKMASHR